MICNFSNVAFYIFGFPIHWYSLAYIAGILIALKLTSVLARRSQSEISPTHIDEFLTTAIVGIILGGRFGHVVFYDSAFYLDNPVEIVKIWKGGMSFFGGFIGVVLSAYIFCKLKRINLLKFMDLWSVSVPIGLFFGRIANLINGELLGKPSDVAWKIIFADGIPRHPSQIYEAMLEGIILFIIMLTSFQKGYYKFAGRLSGVFCCGYAVSRFVAEFFREPDSIFSSKLLLSTGINLNQYMSITMLALGLCLIIRSISRSAS